MNRSVRIFTVLLGLVLLFVRLFYDLYRASIDGAKPAIANDMFNLIWPYDIFASASIHSGTLPLWNPYTALGGPLIGDIGAGLFYPVNWIIYLTGIPSALLIIQFVTVLIGIIGMYQYARYLSFTWPARVLSVTLFAYAVFTESFSPTLGSSYCWLPAILLFTHRLFDHSSLKNASYISVTLALCFLAGFPNFFVYTCLVLGVYFLTLLCFSLSENGFLGSQKRIVMMVAALVLMVGIVAIQLFPAYELSSLSLRNLGPLATYTQDSHWENVSAGLMAKNFFQPDLAYYYALPTMKINSGLYYLGGALFLLPFAYTSDKHRKTVIALSASTVFIFLFIMSYQTPALSILQKIPLASSLRMNGRGIVHIEFLLIVLSGFGLSNICGRVRGAVGAPSKKNAKIGAGLYVVYAVVVAVIGATVAHNTWYLAGFILCGLVVLSSLFEVRTFSWKIHLGWIIALIISVDVSVHRNNRFLVPAFGNIDREFVLSSAEQVRSKPGHYRVLFLAGNLSDEYDLGNVGLKLQFPSINSYNGFTLERWQNYLRYMAGPESFDLVVSRSINQRFYGAFSLQMQSIVLSDPGILGLASVRYYYSKKGNSENVDALPRAYAVSHYTKTDTEEESLAAIKAQLGVLGETVILEGGTPSFIAENQPPHKNGQVEIRRLVPNEVELQVSVTRPSMVILTDAFYPGWKAYVDGEATEIFRANSLFRAVEVPPGRHTVLFKFRPDSLFLGFVVSLVSVGLLAAFLFGTWIVGRRASDFRT